MPTDPELAAVGTRREQTFFGERLVNTGRHTNTLSPENAQKIAEMRAYVETVIRPVGGGEQA